MGSITSHEFQVDFSLTLPDELWMLVFSQLQPRDLVNTALVCRRFAELMCVHHRHRIVIHRTQSLSPAVLERVSWHNPSLVCLTVSSGVCPEDIGGLRILRTLSALQMRCILTDDLVRAVVTALPCLRGLTLWNCSNMSESGVALLSAELQLRTLCLDYCPACGDAALSSFTAFKCLHTLNIRHSSLCDGGMACLARLTTLRALDIHGSNVDKSCDDTTIVNLTALRCLKVLNVGGCGRLTNASLWSLCRLPNLTTLNLSHCPKLSADGLEALCRLPALRTLYLRGCFVDNEGVAALSALSDLTSLDLGYCLQITDSGLARLSELQGLTRLTLSDCHKLTDLKHLHGLRALKTLHLRWCERVNRAAIENLKLELPGLDVIHNM